jgi:hypothetical protein
MKNEVSSSVSVPLCELEPDRVCHVLARNVHNLLTANVGEVLQLRDRIHQGLNAKLSGRVTMLLGALLHTSDGSTRSGNEHLRLRRRLGRGRDRQKASPDAAPDKDRACDKDARLATARERQHDSTSCVYLSNSRTPGGLLGSVSQISPQK